MTHVLTVLVPLPWGPFSPPLYIFPWHIVRSPDRYLPGFQRRMRRSHARSAIEAGGGAARAVCCGPSEAAPAESVASAALRTGLRAWRLHPSQCCGRRAQAAARCVAAMPRWNSHVAVREEPPGGTCESHQKAVASTRDALGGAWCAACVHELCSRAAVAGRGQPAADNSSSVGQEAQSRRLPLKMQLTRGRSRVAIATLDPDSALKRTVGASVGISRIA